MIPVGLEAIGRLESIDVFVAHAEMISPVGTALHQHRNRRVGFIRVRGADAEGFGEIAAMDQVVGTDPSLDAVLSSLRHQWIPRLFEAARTRGGNCPPSHAIGVLGGDTGIDRMAAAGLEMAILDAELRREGLSLARWLNVDAVSMPYGALCGIPQDRSVGALVVEAEAAIDAGASRLRIKVDSSWAFEALGAVRRALPAAALQADANGSLGGERGLDVLRSIDDFGLACIEEPLGISDLTASAALAAELSTPVCLDETVTSLRSVRNALRYQACGVLCVKPGRLGGIRAALGALEEAHRAGVACFIGGMFEAGLGRSVLGVLSGRPEATLVGDVAGASSYLVEDPCGQQGPRGDRQELFCDEGVGPWPDLRLLRPGWEGGQPGL